MASSEDHKCLVHSLQVAHIYKGRKDCGRSSFVSCWQRASDGVGGAPRVSHSQMNEFVVVADRAVLTNHKSAFGCCGSRGSRSLDLTREPPRAINSSNFSLALTHLVRIMATTKLLPLLHQNFKQIKPAPTSHQQVKLTSSPARTRIGRHHYLFYPRMLLLLLDSCSQRVESSGSRAGACYQ